MIVRGPLDPVITEQAGAVDDAWRLWIVLCFAVVALVVGLLLFVMIRYRKRDDVLPRQKHYNIPLEVAYTVIPLVVVIALFGIAVSVDAIADDPTDPVIVDVTAFQWQWQFDYPESGVSVVGGAEPDEIPELVLPAGRDVEFHLESLDVIHSFWVTAFRFKRDMIPGTPSSFAVTIRDDAAGYYPNAGVCAEYCGLDHARMQFTVRVLEPDEFDAWLEQHGTADAAQEAGS